MRTLFLIRHAKSSWSFPGLSDFDRPLNERGEQAAPMMAGILAKSGAIPQLLVTSPAKRAYTTACYFADQFGISHSEIVQELSIYESSTNTLLRLIQQLPSTATTVCMFGHNPTFTDFVNHFSKRFIDNIPTCGMVKLECSAPDWSGLSPENTQVVDIFFPREY